MKNNVENLIIALVVFIVGSAVGGFIGYKAALGAIKAQQPIIEMAIEKNTSEIQNTFQNEFKKIKNKKGEGINVILDSDADSELNSNGVKAKKRGLFRR